MYDDEETTLEESENTFEDDGQQSEPEELNDDDIYNRYDRVKRTPNSGNSPIRHRMMSPKPNINNMGIGQSTQEKANTNSPDNSSDNSKSKASSILLLGSESSELKGKGTIVKALKNPVTRKIILIAIPICLLLIVILLISAAVAVDEFNSGEYEYYTEGACQQVKYQDKLMSIEDYVAGAMATQFGEFSYSESTLKTTAVAIRTYTISHGTKIGDSLDDCYYDVSTNGLEYNPESDYSNYKSAVNSTKSLIITINGKITGGYYDASCVYSASQAKTLDTTGNYTNDNYYIRYGALEIDGINFQPIPIIDVDNLVGSLKEYAEKSIANGACAENNGSGISINGAEYLSASSDYDWKKIINYYYNEKAKIKTTDPSYRQSFTAEGTIFRQADSRWASIPLGTSSINMGNSGCAVTSVAIGISFSGTPLTVDDFDAGIFVRTLNAGGCFTEGGGIKWSCSAINKIAPQVRFIKNDKGVSGTNEEKIAYISSYPLDKYIILTHFRNERAPRGHFVNFQEFINSDEYLARDPSPGSLVTHSIAEIDQVVIYSY